MDGELKAKLLEAMRKPEGMPNLLYALRDLCYEMAGDQRTISQSKDKARSWDRVGWTLNKAAGQAIALLEIG
jgi:hypothetical protein